MQIRTLNKASLLQFIHANFITPHWSFAISIQSVCLKLSSLCLISVFRKIVRAQDRKKGDQYDDHGYYIGHWPLT